MSLAIRSAYINLSIEWFLHGKYTRNTLTYCPGLVDISIPIMLSHGISIGDVMEASTPRYRNATHPFPTLRLDARSMSFHFNLSPS